MSEQVDDYSLYEVGTRELLDRVGQDHRFYSSGLAYQQRLSANIELSRRRGDTDRLRAERNRIINELNKLAVSVLGISFKEICEQTESVRREHSTDRPLCIDDPLSLAKLGAEGPVRPVLADLRRVRSHPNCKEVLRLCKDAAKYAGEYGDQAHIALIYLYQADVHARDSQVEKGIRLAERARRILKIWGDCHNTLVAQLVIAHLRALRDPTDARREYLEALTLCRKLESEKKRTGRGEEARSYQQIGEEIQQALDHVGRITTYAPRYPDAIPILGLSDGPDATVRHSRVIEYHVATGEFEIEGRTYSPHRLNQTEGHTPELQDSGVHFALPVPEDGWLDPASREGDYALVRRGPRVTQEGPGVLWTGQNWVGGRFERDVTTGDIRFVSPRPHIVGEERGYVVALLKPTA